MKWFKSRRPRAERSRGWVCWPRSLTTERQSGASGAMDLIHGKILSSDSWTKSVSASFKWMNITTYRKDLLGKLYFMRFKDKSCANF